MASFGFHQHHHSHSSNIEPIPPHSSLFHAPPPEQQLDSPPKKRRSMSAQHKGLTRYNSSCLPSAVLEAGLDPAAVDFRNFFPYIPNEVKHRKRTSNDQAKVLEAMFDRNTKPDSSLRQRLAKELEMTPRGVQVWFQNRRAKQKLIGKKALAASATAYKKPPSLKQEPSAKSEVSPTSGQDFQSTSTSSSASSSPESSPIRQTHTSIPFEHGGMPSWTAPQSLSPDIPKYEQPGPPQPPADVYSRRPSLPTVIRSPATIPSSALGTPSGPVNLMARRGSVERLGGNPYARFLMSRANSNHPRPTSLRGSHDRGSHHEELSPPTFEMAPPAFTAADRSRPTLGHRASMPHVFTGADMQRRASVPGDLQSVSTYRMPDRRMYALSSRTIAAPIPGPLPAPNFSFGPPADSPAASSPVPADNEGDYLDHVPELANFTFGHRADDNDTEDDLTSVSYDAMSSRFGSIASVTGSESSNTSAYYSDVDSCHELPEWNPEARRGSFASSGQLLDLVSALDLGHEDMAGAMAAHAESGDSSDAGGAAYASPASTISPGRSHGSSPLGKLADVSGQSLPISGSSELAHALQPTNEQSWDRVQVNPPEPSAIPDTNYTVTNVYVHTSTDSRVVYPQANSSLSSSSLPENAQKSYADLQSTQFPDTSLYHSSNPYTQTSPTEGHHSATGSFSPYNGQDALELHHAMEYQNAGYVGGAVDMSHITSTVETALHVPKPYLQYP